MADSKLLDDILAVAETVAPLIPYGKPALDLGKAVVALVDNVAAAADHDTEKLAALVAKRDEIEASMNKHVDDAIAALRG